jgi:hypothetical protein
LHFQWIVGSSLSSGEKGSRNGKQRFGMVGAGQETDVFESYRERDSRMEGGTKNSV